MVILTEKLSAGEMIGMIFVAVIFVVLIFQGERIWDLVERLVAVETKVEIYHE